MIEFDITWCYGDNYSLTMNGVYIDLFSTKQAALDKANSLGHVLHEEGLCYMVHQG